MRAQEICFYLMYMVTLHEGRRLTISRLTQVYPPTSTVPLFVIHNSPHKGRPSEQNISLSYAHALLSAADSSSLISSIQ